MLYLFRVSRRKVHELHIIDTVERDACGLLNLAAVAATVPEKLQDLVGLEKGLESELALSCADRGAECERAKLWAVDEECKVRLEDHDLQKGEWAFAINR